MIWLTKNLRGNSNDAVNVFQDILLQSILSEVEVLVTIDCSSLTGSVFPTSSGSQINAQGFHLHEILEFARVAGSHAKV